jgi:hypothetical protein
MFLMLLGITFVIALVVSFIVAQIFNKPLASILKRIIADEISSAWLKYLKFAVYVVGISSGVRIYELVNSALGCTEKPSASTMPGAVRRRKLSCRF